MIWYDMIWYDTVLYTQNRGPKYNALMYPALKGIFIDMFKAYHSS